MESKFPAKEIKKDFPSLWPHSVFPESLEMPAIDEVRFQIIHQYDPENTGFHWLKGLALARYRNLLFASFGHNKTLSENNATEFAHMSISRDGGSHWDPLSIIDDPCGDLAVSHGVFLNYRDQLWSFHGAFYGEGRPGGRVHTRAYLLEPDSITKERPVWQKKGVVAWDGFWPLQEPIQMGKGQYIVAGTSIGSGEIGNRNTIPAVALIDGEDLTQWQVVRIPPSSDLVDPIWGESTVIVLGSKVILIARSNHVMRTALTSTSTDYGKSWSTLTDSGLPMTDSKPYAGRLSDGRPYLINTFGAEIHSDTREQYLKEDWTRARNPLCILIGDPGSISFNRAYRLIDSRFPPKGASGYRMWAYPYAIEWDQNLVVGFYMDGISGGKHYECGNAGYLMIPIDRMKSL
jgi:hypothetical protein